MKINEVQNVLLCNLRFEKKSCSRHALGNRESTLHTRDESIEFKATLTKGKVQTQRFQFYNYRVRVRGERGVMGDKCKRYRSWLG